MNAQDKKLLSLYIIGIVIFLAILLFPLLIRSGNEENRPTELSTPTESPTHLIFRTPTPSQPVPIIPEGSVDLSAAEQAYDQFMIEHHGKFTRYMDEIGSLFVQAGEDESLLHDENWLLLVNQNLELMLIEAEQIASYQDVPEKFSPVHHWMSQLETETTLFSSIIADALEDKELSKFEADRVITASFNLFNIAVNAMTERQRILVNSN
jgi:hypothetical protein